MDEDEDRGPFTMAVLAGKPIKPIPVAEADGEEPVAEKTGKDYGLVLVTGDASFAANSNLDIGLNLNSPTLESGQIEMISGTSERESLK